MKFNCKSCGAQLRLSRKNLNRGVAVIFILWFAITLWASFFPFSTFVNVALYLVILFAAISIVNLFIPLEEVPQGEDE